MAKHIDPILDGFTIKDLISEEGLTLEIGEEYEPDDEDYSYSSTVQFSNAEILEMLNMNDFDDDDEEEDNEQKASLCHMSFEKLKTKMTNLTPDGKIMKYVKKKGVGDIIPHNAQISVHYVGYFEDHDEPFDSTYTFGAPRSFQLSKGNILPGLEIAIMSMQKHEIAVFLIHPDFAYGKIGCPPRIPPNEEVVFVVHLIDFLDNGCADDYGELDIEERKSFQYIAESVKHILVNAKDSFGKSNIKQSIRHYGKVVNLLENVRLKDEEEETKMNILLSQAFTNLAICYNKLGKSKMACTACNKVPNRTAKTYYHHGKALINLGEYYQATKELHKAYDLEPTNDAIFTAIQLTDKKAREYRQVEKRLWGNCLNSKNKERKPSEFRKAAYDLCKNLIDNNDSARQPFPEGLTPDEANIIREEAALLGLNVVTQIRYGKEIVYLQKREEK